MAEIRHFLGLVPTSAGNRKLEINTISTRRLPNERIASRPPVIVPSGRRAYRRGACSVRGNGGFLRIFDALPSSERPDQHDSHGSTERSRRGDRDSVEAGRFCLWLLISPIEHTPPIAPESCCSRASFPGLWHLRLPRRRSISAPGKRRRSVAVADERKREVVRLRCRHPNGDFSGHGRWHRHHPALSWVHGFWRTMRTPSS